MWSETSSNDPKAKEFKGTHSTLKALYWYDKFYLCYAGWFIARRNNDPSVKGMDIVFSWKNLTKSDQGQKIIHRILDQIFNYIAMEQKISICYDDFDTQDLIKAGKFYPKKEDNEK